MTPADPIRYGPQAWGWGRMLRPAAEGLAAVRGLTRALETQDTEGPTPAGAASPRGHALCRCSGGMVPTCGHSGAIGVRQATGPYRATGPSHCAPQCYRTEEGHSKRTFHVSLGGGGTAVIS